MKKQIAVLTIAALLASPAFAQGKGGNKGGGGGAGKVQVHDQSNKGGDTRGIDRAKEQVNNENAQTRLQRNETRQDANTQGQSGEHKKDKNKDSKAKKDKKSKKEKKDKTQPTTN